MLGYFVSVLVLDLVFYSIVVDVQKEIGYSSGSEREICSHNN